MVARCAGDMFSEGREAGDFGFDPLG